MPTILKSVSNSFDVDAAAFISAIALTALTQTIAVNELVLDLKAFGVWDKCTAIYPFVGGTATTHKYNLKNPVDSDAAYRLVFNGGWTHSATGALPNGSTGYADTKINASTKLNNASSHLAYYSRTNVAVSVSFELGCVDVPNGLRFNMCGGRTFDNGTFYSSDGDTYLTTVVTSKVGFYLGSRIASGNTNSFMYRNGSLVSSATATTVGNQGSPNYNVFIAANNSVGSAVNFSPKECAFASVGSGLTATEVTNYYTAVQKFNGALNRQV